MDALLADGNSVVVLDNLTTGRQENLTQARTNPRFRFVHGSVLDAPLVDELVQECNIVIHLAAAVGVKLIVEQPLRSFITNTKPDDGAELHGRFPRPGPQQHRRRGT
ncbi:GDP-mannose 4,6-dehydratase, partial [Micrococcus luteus]